MEDALRNPGRARQFLPFAALCGFEGCLEDVEAGESARAAEEPASCCSFGTDADDEPPAPASHPQSAAFRQMCESRPWDLRLARILRFEQQGEERETYGGSRSQEEH